MGCANWTPQCGHLACGGMLSGCFEPIRGTKEEVLQFYKDKKEAVK